MKSIRRVDSNGNVKFTNENGLFHREDGPAIEYTDGTKKWLINGMYHREDGPAIEWSDGAKWY